MYVCEVTNRSHNDYQGWLMCRFCEKKTWLGAGYADHYFAYEVIPNRLCSHCGESEYGGLTKLEQGIDVGVVKAADVVITRA